MINDNQSALRFPPDGEAETVGKSSGTELTEFGISTVAAPKNALMGVFLGMDQPDLTPAPSPLEFGTSDSRNFLTLTPLLKQVFFIGDGNTADSLAQRIIVPVGATRLYLGTMDGEGWYNNAGNFTVTVTASNITEIPCTPRKAKASAELVNGFVVGANVTDGGCGYTNPPAVLIQGGGGSGAMARAIVKDGEVTSIQILSAGFAYTNLPKVVIGSPPFVPTVSINVSRVNVIQNVVLGWKYVLESSTNNTDWTATGPFFEAESEVISTEFDVDTVGRYFRLKVVQ